MGYFPNGMSAEIYEQKYCDRCQHQENGCAVWLAHLLRNYEDCNDDGSILHILIPLDGVHNAQCEMFLEKQT